MQVCNNPSSPCGQGTDSSFYRPRGGGLQSCRTVLSYIWQYGVQCRGVVDRPGESRSQQASWRPPVLAQKRLRGWLRGRLPLESSSVRRLKGVADGRPEGVQWWGWRCLVIPGSHSDGDGIAVLGMAAQRFGWPHSADGDGGDALHWSDITASSRAGAG
jgi:hypothetical protein